MPRQYAPQDSPLTALGPAAAAACSSGPVGAGPELRASRCRTVHRCPTLPALWRCYRSESPISKPQGWMTLSLSKGRASTSSVRVSASCIGRSEIDLPGVDGVGTNHPVEEQRAAAVVDLMLERARLEGIGGDQHPFAAQRKQASYGYLGC